MAGEFLERSLEERAGASTQSTSTLTAKIYDRIRDDIVFGVLRPGERLKLDTLKERYGIGMTPLREALYRLSASMLVVVEDRKGFAVAPVSPTHLAEVIATRMEIESLVLRSAFAEGGSAWQTQVVEAFHALRKASQNKPNPGPYTPEWEAAHRDFHFALLAPAKVPMLQEFQHTLWDHSARYRNLAYPGKSSGSEVFVGHEQLMEAVVQRDVEMACMLLRRHIALASAPILAAIFPRPGAQA